MTLRRDREIYLKVLMMDNDGLLKRKNKLLSKETILENITFKDLKNYFEVPIDLFSTETNPNRRLKKAEAKDLEIKASLSSEQKSELQKIAYLVCLMMISSNMLCVQKKQNLKMRIVGKLLMST
jgi:hypothetical protein